MLLGRIGASRSVSVKHALQMVIIHMHMVVMHIVIMHMVIMLMVAMHVTIIICHLCQKHALFLYVIGYHLYARSSEDILAVITYEFGQQQEAKLNAVEGCCKARLKDRLLCNGIFPYLQIKTTWQKGLCVYCTDCILCRPVRSACSCSIKYQASQWLVPILYIPMLCVHSHVVCGLALQQD